MPVRDARYDYPPPGRDYRRPPSPGPMREYRDYGPPPSRYEDYRRPPPLAERDRYGAPDRGRYDYRSAPPAPPHPTYERYDRRAERYPAYGPPSGRPRTPPRYREDLDRPVPRYVVQNFSLIVIHTQSTSDYPDYRGRPMTPPRYPDYPTRGASPDARFRSVTLPLISRLSSNLPRRRSESPAGRSAAAAAGYEYAPPDSNYPATPPGPPPAARRDYPPRGYVDRR